MLAASSRARSRRPASHAADQLESAPPLLSDQVRVGYQPANREAARHRAAANARGARVVGGSNTIEWPRIVLAATQRKKIRQTRRAPGRIGQTAPKGGVP